MSGIPGNLSTKEGSKFLLDKNGDHTVRTFNSNTSVKKGSTYYDRVIVTEESLYNTLDNPTTEISTTATRLVTVVGTKSFLIQNLTENSTVYIGSSSITASVTSLALEDGDVLSVTNMQNADNNEIYGITSSGTALIMISGEIFA